MNYSVVKWFKHEVCSSAQSNSSKETTVTYTHYNVAVLILALYGLKRYGEALQVHKFSCHITKFERNKEK